MRDISEIAPGLEYSMCPIEGVATAGQPSRKHLQSLAGAGYRTVLDLRAPEENRGLDEPEAVREAGMQYINLPVTPDTLRDEIFDRFRQIMDDPARRPILLHCSSANRVGALLLPYMILEEEKSYEEASEIASRVGLRSHELEHKALEYARSNGG
ncbi:fused DSP-PTPase phosphatase/NAD kinase-like protein [Rubrobacter aplysinae]|uniref:fused DSP-PTPase phosphatase/NAD kinase-like protein n=1 Tax=Rubrobacter aplysinae TaxID=909625 RepID=UPI00069E1C7A|nr:protein tyrosine phosphatase family protein [Rubrobacter aplysinae]